MINKTQLQCLLCCLCLLLSLNIKADTVGHWRQVNFNSNQAINFHHLLFDMARTHKPLAEYQWPSGLSTEEVALLRRLTSFYQQHFVSLGRSAMRAALPLQHMTKALTTYSVGNALTLPIQSLQADFVRGLSLYQKHLWPQHDRQNKLWVVKLINLLKTYGSPIQTRLEQQLESPLFTGVTHPVDVVFYPGHKNGAFTQDWPYSMLNSSQSSYQGLAALEMFFHEISHASAADKLFELIQTKFAQQGLQAFQDIWHPILFNLVGQTTKAALAQNKVKYREYAQVQDIYNRGYFSQFTPFIHSSWKATDTWPLTERIQNLAQHIRQNQ